MKSLGAFVLSLVLVFSSVGFAGADLESAPGAGLEWSLFEWATQQRGGQLHWYEWFLLQYTLQVACASLGTGAGAAFTPLAGVVTYELCSFGLAA